MECRFDKFDNPSLVFDIGSGCYCSHWGLTDLYEECEKNLRNLLKTGVDFRTEWCGSKKELLSARYLRVDGKVKVEVHQWVDDLWEEGDLMNDALEEKFPGKDIEISDELNDYIIDIVAESDINDNITLCRELGADATYEDCMTAVGQLADETNKQLTAWYEELCNIIEDAVKSAGLDKGKE